MADINNLNSGDSSSSYGKYPINNGINNTPKVNSSENTSEYSHGWKRAPRPFGLNVRVPQDPIVGVRTQTLVKRVLADIVLAPIKEVDNFFKNYEKVFNGSVSAEIESLQKQQRTTVELLQDADEIVMSDVPSFMMDM